MRTLTVKDRWLWGLSGLVTAAVLAVPGARFLTRTPFIGPGPQPQLTTVTKTLPVPYPVNDITVDTAGAPVHVVTKPVSAVTVTEKLIYPTKPPQQVPVIWPAVSRTGQLQLIDPGCCLMSISLVVPPRMDVTVGSQGGAIAVTGTAATTLDSGGGPVSARQITGPLTAQAEGGGILVSGLIGPLRADSGGGPVIGRDINTSYVDANAEGGNVALTFDNQPRTLVVDTGGGPATLLVPGGPYVVTANTGGGPSALLRIPTDPLATRSITLTTEGGSAVIAPTPGQPVK
jgi:hypothetical protein